MIVPIEKLSRSFMKYPKEADYVIESVPARTLLSYRRFDFYAKLLYIDHYEKGLDLTYAKKLYLAQVSAITHNTNAEEGNDEKNSADLFLSVFNQLINDIKTNGFNADVSLVPVDSNGYVIDGAHRVTIAAYYNLNVTIIRFLDWKTNLKTDWRFLEENFLEEKALDALALECCNWHDNLYMACIWPKSLTKKKEREEADKYIESEVHVVYRKKVSMSWFALHNFMLQIYGHMNWVGSPESHFSGVDAKVKEVVCKDYDECEFLLIEADSYQHIFDLKQAVRKIYGIGLSSIHITDNIRETKQIADLIYNENSLYHVKNAMPDRFLNSFRLVQTFKNIIAENGLKNSNFVVDSSMVMAICGIRNAEDLDFYTDEKYEKMNVLFKDHKIENHENCLKFHGKSVVDLIHNPENYFVFNEVKFVSLPQMLKFKQARGETKDLNDVKMIKSFLHQNVFNRFMLVYCEKKHVLNIWLRTTKKKLGMKFKAFLKSVHLFDVAKKMYKLFVRK